MEDLKCLNKNKTNKGLKSTAICKHINIITDLNTSLLSMEWMHVHSLHGEPPSVGNSYYNGCFTVTNKHCLGLLWLHDVRLCASFVPIFVFYFPGNKNPAERNLQGTILCILSQPLRRAIRIYFRMMNWCKKSCPWQVCALVRIDFKML